MSRNGIDDILEPGACLPRRFVYFFRPESGPVENTLSDEPQRPEPARQADQRRCRQLPDRPCPSQLADGDQERVGAHEGGSDEQREDGGKGDSRRGKGDHHRQDPAGTER
jgi:hypothetical protein